MHESGLDELDCGDQLRQLEPLVGEWTFEAKWPDGEPWPGGGRVTFEWHASGAHLLERGTAELPEAPDNISIIGCDAANGTYFQPFSQRFTGTLSDDGTTITGRWEIAEDGTSYTTDFDLIYRRADT